MKILGLQQLVRLIYSLCSSIKYNLEQKIDFNFARHVYKPSSVSVLRPAISDYGVRLKDIQCYGRNCVQC